MKGSGDAVLLGALSQQPDSVPPPANDPFAPFGLSWKPSEDINPERKAGGEPRIRSVRRRPSVSREHMGRVEEGLRV